MHHNLHGTKTVNPSPTPHKAMSFLNHIKAVSSRGCTRLFIICVLQAALKYCRSLNISPVYPFKVSLVKRWLEEAKRVCESNKGQMWEQFGGVHFDSKNSSTYWLEPHQFFCWWKNNIERRSKFAILQRDADSAASCKNNKQFLRSFFCSVVVTLATNIRQHFERNRYIVSANVAGGRGSYSDEDGRKEVAVSVAGPQIDPVPCLYHPPPDACRFHLETARSLPPRPRTNKTKADLAGCGTVAHACGSSSHTDMDDHHERRDLQEMAKEEEDEEEKEEEEDIPYYSPLYKAPAHKKKQQQQQTLSSSASKSSRLAGGGAFYCTCKDGCCVRYASSAPASAPLAVRPHAQSRKETHTETVTMCNESDTPAPFSSSMFSAFASSPPSSSAFSVQGSALRPPSPNSSSFSLAPDRISLSQSVFPTGESSAPDTNGVSYSSSLLRRPVARHRHREGPHCLPSDDASSASSSLLGMGLDLGEWLCDEEELKFEGEEDEGDGGETKSQMTSTRVRTPTSPLPLPPHCMESDMFSVFEGLDPDTELSPLEQKEGVTGEWRDKERSRERLKQTQTQTQSDCDDLLDFDTLCTQLMPIKEEGRCSHDSLSDSCGGGSISRCRTFESMQGFDDDDGGGGNGDDSHGNRVGSATSEQDLANLGCTALPDSGPGAGQRSNTSASIARISPKLQSLGMSRPNTGLSPQSCLSFSEGIYGKTPKRSCSMDFKRLEEGSGGGVLCGGSLSCPPIVRTVPDHHRHSTAPLPGFLLAGVGGGEGPGEGRYDSRAGSEEVEGWLSPSCTATFAHLDLTHSSPLPPLSPSSLSTSSAPVSSAGGTGTAGTGSCDKNKTSQSDYFFFDDRHVGCRESEKEQKQEDCEVGGLAYLRDVQSYPL